MLGKEQLGLASEFSRLCSENILARNTIPDEASEHWFLSSYGIHTPLGMVFESPEVGVAQNEDEIRFGHYGLHTRDSCSQGKTQPGLVTHGIMCPSL